MLLPTLYLALANPATADLTAVLESEIHRTMEYLAGTPAQPYFLAYRVYDTQITIADHLAPSATCADPALERRGRPGGATRPLTLSKTLGFLRQLGSRER